MGATNEVPGERDIEILITNTPMDTDKIKILWIKEMLVHWIK